MRHAFLVAVLLAVTTPSVGRPADADAEQDVASLSGQITDAVVKDVNPGAGSLDDAGIPSSFAAVNGQVHFTADHLRSSAFGRDRQ
jgi:hypothetical protein